RVNANAFGPQQARLGDGIPEVAPAVADKDDVAAAVVGKDRATKLQCRRQVGVVGIWLALELAELRCLADVDLDLWIAAEAQHAGAIVTLSLLENPADGGGFAIERA